MEYEIRPYRESDEEGVVGLWNEVFPDQPPRNDPRASIRRKLAVQRELFFVATAAGEILGTAMAGYDGHRGWVYSVATRPELRAKGIGRALMERVERELTSLGCPKLNLQVVSSNRGVVAFYERLGYSVEERVSMGKVLEPGTRREI